MACCGRKKSNPKPNGRICPKCGWVMYRVHKYDTSTKQVNRYWLCSNKRAFKTQTQTGACNFREKIE